MTIFRFRLPVWRRPSHKKTATPHVLLGRHLTYFSGDTSRTFAATPRVLFRRHLAYFSSPILGPTADPFRPNGGPVPGIAASTARASLTNRHRPKEHDDARHQARPQPRELTLNQEPNGARKPRELTLNQEPNGARRDNPATAAPLLAESVAVFFTFFL